jgi:hypothetical protein
MLTYKITLRFKTLLFFREFQFYSKYLHFKVLWNEGKTCLKKVSLFIPLSIVCEFPFKFKRLRFTVQNMFDYPSTNMKNKFTRCLERLAGKCFFFVFRFREILWCPRGRAWQPSPSGSGGCDREAQDQRYSEKVNYWKKIIFWNKIYRYSHLHGLNGGLIRCSEVWNKKKQNNLILKTKQTKICSDTKK